MTDQPSPVQTPEGGETEPYPPAAGGGREAAAPETGDYRERLRSRRWNAAPLENPEVEKTDPRLAVLAIVVLAAITLVVLVVGYGVLDLWSLPT